MTPTPLRGAARPRIFPYLLRGLLAVGAALLAPMLLVPSPAAQAQEDATTATNTFEEDATASPQQEEEAILQTTTITPETTTPPASMTTVPAYENTAPVEDTTSAPAAEEQYGPPATLADTGGTGPLVVFAALFLGAAILAFGVIRSRPAGEQPDRASEGGDDDFMPRG